VIYLGPTAYLRNASLGAVESSLWPTTGDIDTETASLAASVHQLAGDIFDAQPLPDTADYQVFQNAWNAFIADFTQWKDAAWFWNLTRRDQLLGYRTRFNELLDKAKALGTSTLASPQADSGTDPVSKFLGTLTTVALVVGVAVAGYYGSQILRKGGA
jgi:hypothetical protein